MGGGALWCQRLVRDVALAVGETPAPRVYGVLDQLLGQAVPISFMDGGPLVAAGIPAVRLAGTVPPEHAELHYATYHNPADTLELQAAGPLGHTGRVTEAAVRQLQAMTAFPSESGPFLCFEDTHAVLRGWPLTLALGPSWPSSRCPVPGCWPGRHAASGPPGAPWRCTSHTCGCRWWRRRRCSTA